LEKPNAKIAAKINHLMVSPLSPSGVIYAFNNEKIIRQKRKACKE
jgi:hypothetical protein